MKLWCVTDDKPGHRRQLEGLIKGLVNALSSNEESANEEVECQWLSINDQQQWRTQSAPDLILAAGSHTHLSALRLRLRHGGKLVVIMKPWLPRFFFDLCILPRHDGVPEGWRVINTVGAMNPIPLSEQSNPRRGLLLIGGPSKHYGWSDQSILSQLNELVTADQQIRWTLTTSRRTPDSFIDALASAAENHHALSTIEVVPFEQTDSGWLLDHYRQCGQIWVTEDSVSMVYESLSSGARTGVLKVPRLADNRVSRGLDQLLQEQRVCQLGQPGLFSMTSTSEPLREAERVAKSILQRFFSDKVLAKVAS